MTRMTTHPGEMLLEEFMQPLDLSARELARALDVPHNRVSEMVAGRRSMTADTALRLERYFGMEARFWLNLQVSHDLSKARNEETTKSSSPARRLDFPRQDSRAAKTRTVNFRRSPAVGWVDF